MNRKWALIVFILFIVINCNKITAVDVKINLHDQDITSAFNLLSNNGALLVRARDLADVIGAELRWINSISTLEISKNDINLKMMIGSPYLQIGKETSRMNSEMLMKEGHVYVPLRPVLEGLGYLVKIDGNNNYYISKPKSFINKISWGDNNRKLIIEMSKLTPYRIRRTDDSSKLILELENAALSSDFIDNLSNKNFYLRFNRIENNGLLQLEIISKYTIPFQRDGGIKEQDNKLILNFMTHIQEISWKEDSLKIVSNGDIKQPEISFFEDPRRLVIDIPEMMLSEYDINLRDNNWVKDIRISQFTYNPAVLRIVLDLKDNRYLHQVESKENMLIFEPAHRTNLSDLSYTKNTVSFISNISIKPEQFTLNKPDRLVFDIYNAVRADDFPDKIDVSNGLIRKIRSSQFDKNILRLVIELEELQGYKWQQELLSDNKYKNTILLGNNLESIEFKEEDLYTNINLNFSGDINYEVKKLSSPHRIVVDVEGLETEIKENLLPEVKGIIKDIRTGTFKIDDTKITRFVFTLEDYYGYEIISEQPAATVNIAVAQEKLDKHGNLIVVDAGHGGFDPGAMGPSGLCEKDVTLDIALQVRDNLLEQGYRVLMTRKNDTFISLKQRVDQANTADARLFVSIHINGSNEEYSEGTETFIAPDKTSGSLPLANSLQKSMLDKLQLVDRGIKKDNFYVIKYTEMPAALVEIAFISNPHEESLLSSNLFKKNAAAAISDGIIDYLQKFEGPGE